MAPHSDRLNHPPGHGHIPVRGVDIASELRYLVRSAEPAVVFSSLAHLCVPIFSDVCTIDIVEHGEIAYRICYSRPDTDDAGDAAADDFDQALSTPFAWAGTGPDDTGYAGVITHRWLTRRPDAGDVARAANLARHGVATVTEERRSGDTHPEHQKRRRAVFDDGRPDGGPAAAQVDTVDAVETQLRPSPQATHERRSTYQAWRCRTAT